jgi:hypothetical protein
MKTGDMPIIYLCSNQVPDVTGHKIVAALFGDEEICDPDWNKLLRTAHEHAYRHFPCDHEDKLARVEEITGRKIVHGDASAQNRMYMSSIGASIWREDARDALEISARLARNLQRRMEVVIFLKGRRTRLVEDLDEFIFSAA